MTIGNVIQNTFGGIKLHKGEIGLEIETESKQEYAIPKFAFWTTHADNSLRNFGIEYVLRAPLLFKDEFPKALDEFQDKLKEIKFIENSITTSVHCHLNFLNENFITLGNFLTIYTLVENLLMRFSGENRLSNLFCLPICDAEETYYNILRLLDGIKHKNYARLAFEPEGTKYAALNLSSLTRFGSLEQRSFRGTTDTKLIYTWVSILYALLEYSRRKEMIPPDIIKRFKEVGLGILDDVFGKYRLHLKVPNEKDLVEKNFWYATNTAYAIKDWKALEKPEVKKPKLKDLDKLANKLYATPFHNLTMAQAQLVIEQAERAMDRAIETDNFGAEIERITRHAEGARAQNRGTTTRITPFETMEVRGFDPVEPGRNEELE